MEKTRRLGFARLRRSLTLGLLVALGFGCRQDPAQRVILISIDTLRADYLGCYGHELPTSPALDALAAEGVLFEDVLAPSPWTLPSHASLLTGLYPRRHGATSPTRALRDDIPTLASLLTQHGFLTAGVVNSVYLQPWFALDRGFGHYAVVSTDPEIRSTASATTDEGLRWLGNLGDRRTLLFLHYFDVHSDYRARPEYVRMFAEGPGRFDGSTAQLRQVLLGSLSAADEDARHLRRLYDAEIRQLDDELARLFAWLRERGWWEDTLLIVTSDHGEEFLEHGSVMHGATQYQEVLRIPLLMRGPGIPAGVRIETPASLVDVLPTVAALLALPRPEGIDGRDLSALWEGRAADLPARPLFAEASLALVQRHPSDSVRAVRAGRYKLIEDRRSGTLELYDLEEDPGERSDVSARHADVVERLSRALEAHVGASAPGRPLPDLPAEDRERLRALGYL